MAEAFLAFCLIALALTFAIIADWLRYTSKGGRY